MIRLAEEMRLRALARRERCAYLAQRAILALHLKEYRLAAALAGVAVREAELVLELEEGAEWRDSRDRERAGGQEIGALARHFTRGRR